MFKYQVVLECVQNDYGTDIDGELVPLEVVCGPQFDTLAEAGAHLEVVMRTRPEVVIDTLDDIVISYGEYLIRVIDMQRRGLA